MKWINIAINALSASQSWGSYWTTLISATVENAAPTHVVLTFPTAKTSLGASDFTCTVNGVARTVNSASWAGAVLTLVLASACVYGDIAVVTFVKTGGTTSVTNNIVAEAELTTYITGLVTPLSSAIKKKINDFIKTLKSNFSIASLSDAFDVMFILGGETEEASLKNLVKDAHHATNNHSTAFTSGAGFTGDGSNDYLSFDWNGRTAGHAVTYSLNSGSFGIYFNTDLSGADVARVNGWYSTTADGGVNNRIMITHPACAPGGSNDNYAVAVNGSYADVGGTNAQCMLTGSRTASNVVKLYKDKVSIIDGTTESSKIPDQSGVLLARRAADTTIGLYDDNQISFAFLGKGLTATEVGYIVDAWAAFFLSSEIYDESKMNNAIVL